MNLPNKKQTNCVTLRLCITFILERKIYRKKKMFIYSTTHTTKRIFHFPAFLSFQTWIITKIGIIIARSFSNCNSFSKKN